MENLSVHEKAVINQVVFHNKDYWNTSDFIFGLIPWSSVLALICVVCICSSVTLPLLMIALKLILGLFVGLGFWGDLTFLSLSSAPTSCRQSRQDENIWKVSHLIDCRTPVTHTLSTPRSPIHTHTAREPTFTGVIVESMYKILPKTLLLKYAIKQN